MSSDFNISEFRRRRASDNPPPPETGQLPFDMPVPDLNAPQEFVPQMSAPVIPDAVPNPYAPLTQIAPQYTQPAVNPDAVYPSSFIQMTAPPPMPAAAPELAKKDSKSLIAGLLGKFKKQTSETGTAPAASGPIEFQATETHQHAPPATRQAAPLRAAIPAKAETYNAMPVVKSKTRMPAWAAFLLGIMAGIILTFAGLALMADQASNSLEARFSDIADTVQSTELATKDAPAEPAAKPTDRRDDL